MSSPIPIYSVNDLKSTTDDTLPTILTSSKLPSSTRFTAIHTKSDVHLLLGYAAVLVGGLSFWADRKWDFNTTYPYLAIAVCIYFALNLALTVWVLFVEKGCVFEGRNEKGEMIQISSRAKKHSPIYTLQIKCISKDGKVLQNESIQKGFNEWFSSDGLIQSEPLKEWLMESIIPLKETTEKK